MSNFFSGREKGVATVVGAFLVMAILFSAFSIWFVTQLPKWKKEDEAKFSSEVQEKFRELRTNANLLAVKEVSGLSLSTTIDAEGSDIPLLPDAVRQGTLSTRPGEGALTVTRYWNGGDTYYQSGGSFELSRENEYYTDDGTATGDSDWYSQRRVKDLSTFNVEFHEETEPKPFDIEKEKSYDEEDDKDEKTLVKNVEDIATFDVQFMELKKLELTVRDGVAWKGKFRKRDNNLRIDIVVNNKNAETYLVEGYFDSDSDNYRKELNPLKEKYRLAESIKGESGYDVERTFTGDLHWKYHITGRHVPVQIDTDFDTKLMKEETDYWEAQIQMNNKNLVIQISVRGDSKGTHTIGGYFDPSSENYRKTVDLLEDKYLIENAISGVDNYDLKFLQGATAYGTYTLSGTSVGGVVGGAQSESWSYNTGTVSFNPRNNYYVTQVLSFEMGAIILKQDDSSLLLEPPQFSFAVNSNDVTEVSIHSIDLQGGAFSGSGSVSFTVELSFEKSVVSYEKKNPNSDVLVIELWTDHLKAWKSFFVKCLSEAGLKKEKGFVIEAKSSNHLLVAINGKDGIHAVNLLHLGGTVLSVEARSG